MPIKLRNIAAFCTIVMGFFMALLDTTIVNITLPKMMQYFRTDVSTISWVVSGYNLAFAVLLITASRLADQFGRKRVFLIGLFFFTLTSFLCGISTSEYMLIWFRVVQGLAAALVVPVTLPLAITLFPPEKGGTIIGIWTAFSGLAAASGPTLGGLISENFHWQWIFFINVPIGVLTMLFTAILIGESFDPTATRKLDWPGMLTLSVWAFCLTLGLVQANDKGWASPYILFLFALAVAGFVLFLIAEKRVKEPMLPLWLMGIKPFFASSIALFIWGIGAIDGVFFLTLFLTQVLEWGQLHAAIVITILPIASIVASVVAGPLSDRWGSSWLGAAGMAIFALAVYLMSGLNPLSTHGDIAWRLVVMGIGMGMVLSPVIGAAVRAVPAEKVGIASGVGNMTRTLGMVMGVAIIVSLFTANVNRRIDAAKPRAIAAVEASAILKQQAKDAVVKRVQSARFSEKERLPTQQELIAQLKAKEEKTLKSVPAFAKAPVQDVFDQQVQEVGRIFPQVREIFRQSISAAFAATFKFSSLIVLVGIFFAFRCEPGIKRKEV